MTATHKVYLHSLGFTNTVMMADFLDNDPKQTYSLQIIMVAMLNSIHIRIVQPEGELHTHEPSGDKCCCLFTLARMADGTFRGLWKLCVNEAADLKKWVDCKVPEPVPSHAKKTPSKVFHSKLALQ